MQCDICGEEVENSEDLAKHKEKLHAIADGEKDGEPEMEPEGAPESDLPEPVITPPPLTR